MAQDEDATTATEATEESDGRGHFFAVEGLVWARVCARGRINEAVAYLALARGAHFSTRNSAWSVDAIERRTGISRPRAKTAVEDLVKSGLVQRIRGGTKPLYHLPTEHEIKHPPKAPVVPSEKQQLVLDKVDAAGEPIMVPARGTEANGWPTGSWAQIAEGMVRVGMLARAPMSKYKLGPVVEPPEAPKPDWTWLPNSLVDGIEGHLPPVEQIRQTHSVAALRLLVDLYFAQSLAFNGGVHWRQIRESFTKHKLGQRGPYDVFVFTRGDRQTWGRVAFAAAHMTGKGEKIESADGSTVIRDEGWSIFWDALDKLVALGLVVFVPHIIDADTDEGEVIHPYGIVGSEDAEKKIGLAAWRAAARLVREEQWQWPSSGLALPVPLMRHLDKAEMVGLLRLRHRAKTRATAQWLSNAGDWAEWVRQYDELGQEAQSAQSHATSKGHQ